MLMSHQSHKVNFRVSADAAASALAIVFVLVLIVTQVAQAQTFQVIHNFTGRADGSEPTGGLTIDKAGNLYGTTNQDGPGSAGTVFKLAHEGLGWVLAPLYNFTGGSDGAYPAARVVFGPDGSLYGTTTHGGISCLPFDTCGTVFNLKPPFTACKSALCPWTESVLYRFSNGLDGASPNDEVTFDFAGNMYLTTLYGVVKDAGAVVMLTPSDGSWILSVLHDFTGGNDGDENGGSGGVIPDTAGNLYGVTLTGGAYQQGVVFQLSHSGSGWTENVLYSFQGASDGILPTGLLVFDKSGNLYGGTAGGGGTVFELSPANGGRNLTTLYSFTGSNGPTRGVTMDAAGNLCGTTFGDGKYGYGSAFKLTPFNGSWTYTDLYDFTGGSDGKYVDSHVVFDANGNLYGTAAGGGTGCSGNGCGVVWEITP
jgi:uncharacterized repeat protein (TIGR03803 family)